jgi:hypothetical protein
MGKKAYEALRTNLLGNTKKDKEKPQQGYKIF